MWAGQGLSHWSWEGPEVTHPEWWSRGPCEALRMWLGLRAPPPTPIPASPGLVPEGLETQEQSADTQPASGRPPPTLLLRPPAMALQMTILQGHLSVSVPLCSKVKTNYGEAGPGLSHQNLLPPPGPRKAVELGTAPSRPGQTVPLNGL